MNRDESFLKSALQNYTRTLYNFIRRFGFSNEDTEDILQEIFIKVWKHKDSFDEEKSSLKTWIFTISKNTIYDALRKNKRIKKITSLDGELPDGQTKEYEDLSLDILKLLEHTELKNQLLRAINSLHENEKTILLLHEEESLTFNEIAIIFDSPLNTIKSNYRRSLQKLRVFLEALHQK